MHVHVRGGVTPKIAASRETATGIKVALIANHGRHWEIDSDEKLLEFLKSSKETKIHGKSFLVGIQVNDRDWFRQIAPKTRKQFDYVLADALIMENPDGTSTKLWEIKNIEDPNKWMTDYFRHNMQILDEPITIFSNPTYLPKCIENMYDELWTDERIELFVRKAVKNGIVLEIQAESPFQANERFMKIAKKNGAKFSFGSNNLGGSVVKLDSWFKAIEIGDLTFGDIWTPPERK